MIRTLRDNKTLHEMLIGMFLPGILIGILCFVLSKRPLYTITGLILGLLGALFMVIHMAYTIEDAVLLNENDAVGYTRRMTIIRYAVICVLMLAVGITDICSPILFVIGLLLLKAGAYMQPLVHKLFYGRRQQDELKDELNSILGESSEDTDKI